VVDADFPAKTSLQTAGLPHLADGGSAAGIAREGTQRSMPIRRMARRTERGCGLHRTEEPRGLVGGLDDPDAGDRPTGLGRLLGAGGVSYSAGARRGVREVERRNEDRL
jgi:hypothetical protein